eukprot:scaffold4365_cov137-Ochromonas_danica.AAC.3
MIPTELSLVAETFTAEVANYGSPIEVDCTIKLQEGNRIPRAEQDQQVRRKDNRVAGIFPTVLGS